MEKTTWESVRRALATRETAAEREVAAWSIAELEQTLGPRWLDGASQAEPQPALLAALVRGAWHNVAFGEIVVAAALAGTAVPLHGGGAWRRELKSDPRAGRWAHSQLQAGVAASALEAGYGVRLEEHRPGAASPLDVTILAGTDILAVETRVLGASVAALAAHAAADAAMDRLSDAAFAAGRRLAGRVQRVPEDHEFERIESWLNRLPDAGATARRWQARGVELEAFPFGANHRSLTGPLVGEPSLPRILSVLTEKAEQAEKSGADWLRVEIANGLWGTTPWSRLGLSEKLNALESALRDAVPALARIGLVISSTRSMVAGAQSEVVASGASRGLRVAIGPFWARESLILTPSGESSPAAEVWERVVSAEGTWLPAALSAFGFGESVGALLGASPA